MNKSVYVVSLSSIKQSNKKSHFPLPRLPTEIPFYIKMAQFLTIFWQDTEGFLDFLPGERFKYINVTIIDNLVPELDKVFRVELYNPNGGGKKTCVVKNLLFRLILCPLFYLRDFLRMQCLLWAPFMLFGHDYGILSLILICTLCDSCYLWFESCVLLSGYCVLL